MATDNPILAKAQGSSQPTADDLAYEAHMAASKKAAPANPPADPKLQAIEDALAGEIARNQATTAKLEGSAQQVDMATDIIKSSMQTAASSTKIIAGAQMAADLTAQNQTNAVFAAAGGIESQVKEMSRLKEQGDNINALFDQKADIMDDEHTGLGIIDFVINSFRTIPVQTDLKLAAKQYNATVGHVQNVTAAQEGFNRIIVANKQTINDSTIAATYRKIEAESKMQGAEQDIRNVQHNSDMMTRVAQADSRVTANLLESYRLSGAAESRAITQERIGFERESMANQREMWEAEKPKVAMQMRALELQLADSEAATPAKRAQYAEVVRKAEEGRRFEQQFNTSVRTAQSALSLPIETAEQVQFKLDNPSTRDRYLKLAEIGNARASELTFGADPYDAFTTRRLLDPNSTAQETKASALLETISRRQLEAYTAAQQSPPKDELTYKKDFNTTAKSYLADKAKEIVAGDYSNPYQAPPMGVLDNYAIVQNSPLWKNVLSKTGMTETVPQTIVEQAAAGVAAKLISPEEAAMGVTAIFKAATMHNNEADGGFRREGMAEFEQRSYNTLVTYKPTFFDSLKDTNLSIGVNPLLQAAYDQAGSQGLFSLNYKAPQRSEVVNLLDEAAVQQIIIKQLNSIKPTKEGK